MQDHLDYYIELVNHEEKSFSEALEELVEIEKKNNQMRRDIANVKVANAVLDRLLHHSTVISIKGPSYRLKDKRAFLEAQEAEAYRDKL